MKNQKALEAAVALGRIAREAETVKEFAEENEGSAIISIGRMDDGEQSSLDIVIGGELLDVVRAVIRAMQDNEQVKNIINLATSLYPAIEIYKNA